MVYVLGILAVLTVLILTFSRVSYRNAFWSDRSKPADDLDLRHIKATPERKEDMKALISGMIAEPSVDVEIRSYDGLRLMGRYYARTPGAPLVICFHGYKGTARRDFSGGGQLVLENGYNLLLVDERAQGRSEGKTMTFGIKERRDVLSWVEYAEKTLGYDQIVLCGISMGGATVLMATELELSPSVKCAIADCPHNKPMDIIMRVAERSMHMPTWTFIFVAVAARVYGGFNIYESSPSEAVKHTRVPIMIIHGLSDSFVPEFFSKEIADANPEMIRRYTFEGAEHGLSYYADMDRYKKLTVEFIRENTAG